MNQSTFYERSNGHESTDQQYHEINAVK